MEHSRHLSFFTFALNYHFSKLDPFGYHVFNFGVHLMTVCFIWWLTLLLFRTPRLRRSAVPVSAEAELIAFFAALLFLVHPGNTQAITYISQRFESMTAMFYVAAVCFYLKWRLSDRHFYFVPSFLTAIAAMLCKETAFTLPFCILLIEMIFFERSFKKSFSWQMVLPWIAILFIIPVLIPDQVHLTVFGPRLSASHDNEMISFVEYQLTQLRVLARFFSLIFLPINQNFDYDFPKSTSLFSPWTTLTSFCFLLFLWAASFRLKKNHILLAFGIWWFFLTASINLVPRSFLIFEHKFYLMAIGMMIAIPVFVFSILKNRKYAVFCLSALVLVFSILTFLRNKVWENELTLWSDVIKKSPNKYTANQNLGCALFKAGDLSKALEYFNRALASRPGFMAFNNRAAVYFELGREKEALSDIQSAIERHPGYPHPYNLLGKIYEKNGQYDKAIASFDHAIELGPHELEPRLSRGALLSAMGHVDQGFEDFQEAVRTWPSSGKALYNCGVTYFAKGNFSKALEYFDKAIKIEPNWPLTYLKRGELYRRQGLKDFARRDFQKALDLDPSNQAARDSIKNLGAQ